MCCASSCFSFYRNHLVGSYSNFQPLDRKFLEHGSIASAYVCRSCANFFVAESVLNRAANGFEASWSHSAPRCIYRTTIHPLGAHTFRIVNFGVQRVLEVHTSDTLNLPTELDKRLKTFHPGSSRLLTNMHSADYSTHTGKTLSAILHLSTITRKLLVLTGNFHISTLCTPPSMHFNLILHRLLEQIPQLLPLNLQVGRLQARRKHKHSRLRNRAFNKVIQIALAEA